MKPSGSYRGKGTSAKLTKDGKPKHAGNWSASTIHAQSLQCRDYHVIRKNGQLIVGDHTPLSGIMGNAIAELATTNPRFDAYVEKGVKTVNGQQYEAQRSLRRFTPCGSSIYFAYEFIYREQINTDGDFDYNFPEY
ncbi:hypothetical protein J6A32_10415 [Methanocorpusculum sp.]|nr:hypothetical protein [Methanocorpusculum sp.]